MDEGHSWDTAALADARHGRMLLRHNAVVVIVVVCGCVGCDFLCRDGGSSVLAFDCASITVCGYGSLFVALGLWYWYALFLFGVYV